MRGAAAGTVSPASMAPTITPTPTMTTYVYQTIPQQPGEIPRYFEIKQKMSDEALTRHPESGEAIRRVIMGGFGLLNTSKKSSSGSTDGGYCGGAGCCG